MRFAKFAGEDGKPVYINPALVETIRELNDRLCLVQFDAGAVHVPCLSPSWWTIWKKPPDKVRSPNAISLTCAAPTHCV